VVSSFSGHLDSGKSAKEGEDHDWYGMCKSSGVENLMTHHRAA
jgi:hypothetical protein